MMLSHGKGGKGSVYHCSGVHKGSQQIIKAAVNKIVPANLG